MKRTAKLTLSCAAATALAFGCLGTAAAATTWNSSGQVDLPGGVVFDSADLDTIETRITNGKNAVGTAAKTLKGDADSSVSAASTFAEIAAAVQNQISIPANSDGSPKTIGQLVDAAVPMASFPTGVTFFKDGDVWKATVSKTEEVKPGVTVTYGGTTAVSSASESSDVKAGKFAYDSNGNLIVGSLYDSSGSGSLASQVAASVMVGNAEAGDVLSGKTFTNATESGATGTMPNLSSNPEVVTASSSSGTVEYDVTDGYHTKVKVDQSGPYNAGKQEVLDHPEGFLTGKAAATYTPTTSDQVIAANQWLTGAQTIAGDADLVAGNIKSGVNLFGVNGTFTSDATALEWDILQGKTAYVCGEKVTGTMANYSRNKQTVVTNGLNGTKEYDIPDGFHVKIKVDQTATYAAGMDAAAQGDATASRVLQGYTFTSRAGIGLTGTIANYSLSPRQISTSGGTGVQTIVLPTGYHTKVKVDRTATYNAGANSVWSQIKGKGGNYANVDTLAKLNDAINADNISYNAAHAREYCITNNIYVPKSITFTIEHTQYVPGESGFQVGQELENVGWHYAKILQIDSDLHFMGHYYVSVGDIFDISEEPYIKAVLGKSNLSSEGQRVHGIAKIYLYN